MNCNRKPTVSVISEINRNQYSNEYEVILRVKLIMTAKEIQKYRTENFDKKKTIKIIEKYALNP